MLYFQVKCSRMTLHFLYTGWEMILVERTKDLHGKNKVGISLLQLTIFIIISSRKLLIYKPTIIYQELRDRQ